MKANFLVTPHPGARIGGALRLFVTDPYITHILERDGELSRYEEVVTAPPLRTTREIFQRDHEFVDGKYHRYVEILSRRLNDIHETRHDQHFWKKAMAMALLRHITLCYDLFQYCEKYLNPNEHDFRILDEGSFFVPGDFTEHRRFFEHCDFGQEQLFSIYCRLFHSPQSEEWSDSHVWPGGPRRLTPPIRYSEWLRRLPRRIARRLLTLRRPRVAVIRSYFSEEHFDQLLFRSRGLIQFVQMPAGVVSDQALDFKRREVLCREEDGFDRFDRFAFAALRHGMPRMFVEDFHANEVNYLRFLQRFPEISWIVCEAWIGDAESALMLALAQEENILHLYNEHNYIAHPFLGNNLEYILPLVDRFATLGWRSDQNKKVVAAGSLFKWTDPLPRTGGGEILYVASLPQVRPPEVNASYGDSGPVNVPRYFDFVERFLAALSDETAKEVVMRPYPTGYPRTLQAWDFKYRLRRQLTRMRRVDETEGRARSLMYAARLVIVDYFSTAFLEALLADVPTIFLWNTQTRYVSDGHRDFFAALIQAGVCQTDPEQAAAFVESIGADPARWWRRDDVRAAVRGFLAANMGPPGALTEHLLRLARETGPGPER